MAINFVIPEDTTWISAPSCLLFEKLKSEGHLFDWVTGGWAWKLLLRFQLLRICIVAQVFLAFPQGNGASCYIEEAFCLWVDIRHVSRVNQWQMQLSLSRVNQWQMQLNLSRVNQWQMQLNLSRVNQWRMSWMNQWLSRELQRPGVKIKAAANGKSGKRLALRQWRPRNLCEKPLAGGWLKRRLYIVHLAPQVTMAKLASWASVVSVWIAPASGASVSRPWKSCWLSVVVNVPRRRTVAMFVQAGFDCQPI